MKIIIIINKHVIHIKKLKKMKNANNIYSNPKKNIEKKKKPQLKLLHRATYCQLSPQVGFKLFFFFLKTYF